MENLTKKTGRPKGSKQKINFKGHFTKKEIKELVKLAKDKARSGDRDMQKFLIEQLYGKPVQSNAFTNKQGDDLVIQQVIYSTKGTIDKVV